MSALGSLLINIGELEIMAADFVWLIVGLDKETGMALTRGVSFGRLVEMSGELFRARVTDATLLIEQAALWKRLDDARVERNKYVHASWTLTMPLSKGLASLGDDVGRVRRPHRGAVREEFERMNPSSIEALGTSFALLFLDLVGFWDRAERWLTDNLK